MKQLLFGLEFDSNKSSYITGSICEIGEIMNRIRRRKLIIMFWMAQEQRYVFFKKGYLELIWESFVLYDKVMMRIYISFYIHNWAVEVARNNEWYFRILNCEWREKKNLHMICISLYSDYSKDLELYTLQIKWLLLKRKPLCQKSKSLVISNFDIF